MLQQSSEDAASVAAVIEVLDRQVAELDPASKVAEVWADWKDILEGRPLPWAVPWNIAAVPAAT